MPVTGTVEEEIGLQEKKRDSKTAGPGLNRKNILILDSNKSLDIYVRLLNEREYNAISMSSSEDIIEHAEAFMKEATLDGVIIGYSPDCVEIIRELREGKKYAGKILVHSSDPEVLTLADKLTALNINNVAVHERNGSVDYIAEWLSR